MPTPATPAATSRRPWPGHGEPGHGGRKRHVEAEEARVGDDLSSENRPPGSRIPGDEDAADRGDQ